MSVVLSEHLPLLAAAPDGIQKLRGLILELAVRGKLVPQDPRDEPASELLKKIAQERARLEAEGICRKSKTAPLVGEDEQPFSLPGGWEWSRLGAVSIINPKNSADDSTIASFVPMAMIGTSFDGKHSQEHRKWGEIKQGFTHFAEKDVGVAKITPCFENSKACVFENLQSGIGAGTTELHIVRPISATLLPRFVLAYLKTPMFLLVGETRMTGTAGQKRLPKDFLELNPFPVPPLAEQHRIVSKVDELMALCDRLEAEQMDAEAAHTRLVETLLDTLTQSTDATELATNWQRLAEHFDTLFTTESSLDALKQTILQLAVMGKLVPQDPDDEPASDLLKRIAKERTRLQAKGVSKTLKPLPSIGKDNQPSGWDSASLPELCEIGGGATPSKAKSAYWGEGIPWVSPKDMKVDHIFDTQDHVTELALSETRLPRIKPRSLLVVVRGMILLHSFPVATTQIEVAINQDMKSLTPFFPELLPYLALVFRGWKAQILELVDRSTHGTCKLQSEKLFAFRFGIPPLAEQHRIVAKVDELTALCDRLKADLVESRSRQARLSATLIESALQTA